MQYKRERQYIYIIYTINMQTVQQHIQCAVKKPFSKHVPACSSHIVWRWLTKSACEIVSRRGDTSLHARGFNFAGENLTNHQPVWASSCEQCRNHLPRSWNRRLASDSNDSEAFVPQKVSLSCSLTGSVPRHRLGPLEEYGETWQQLGVGETDHSSLQEFDFSKVL